MAQPRSAAALAPPARAIERREPFANGGFAAKAPISVRVMSTAGIHLLTA
jgi:hypothetical protein